MMISQSLSQYTKICMAPPTEHMHVQRRLNDSTQREKKSEIKQK